MARARTSVALWHHDPIDAIKLDLVLLIQSMEVETALATGAKYRILNLCRGCVLLLCKLLVRKSLMRARCLRVVLSTDLTG